MREALHVYADRGIFRGLSEAATGPGCHAFTFRWLAGRAMELRYEAGPRRLVFADLLPGVPARSALDRELREILKQRQAADLPAHRRIDPRRATVSCANRKGTVSVVMTVQSGQYGYAVGKLVNLVHDLFVHLGDHHYDYMCETFGVRQE